MHTVEMTMGEKFLGEGTISKRIQRGAAGAAWRCEDCSVWWGSQMSGKPKTNFLLDLPAHVARRLPWDEYRGWKLGGEAWTCPECGKPSGYVVYMAT